jgi:exodeoxyribonuclease-3
MRIATWNVNSLAARLEKVKWWLARAQPDVLLMQETKLGDAAAPRPEFSGMGYELAHHGAGGWNGVAIASRRGISDVVTNFGVPLDAPANAEAPDEAPDDQPLREPRMIAAVCGGVRVVSIYAPNGRTVGSIFYQAKLGWFRRLQQWLAETRRPDEALVVGGDYNVAPEDADVWDPARCHGGTHVSPPERQAFADIGRWGLVDAYRKLHPERERYSWWDYRAGNFHKGLGLRIDYVLTTPGLGDDVKRAGMARDYRKGKKPSDHAPLFAQIGAETDGVTVPDASDSKQV